MKSNEMAGLGNWNTALFWEYGTREAQRKNLDPVFNPSVSPYAVFDRNPIWNNDALGNEPNKYDVNGTTGEVKQTGTEGGDKVDYVHLHYETPKHVPETTAVKPPALILGLGSLPACDYEIPVCTVGGLRQGAGFGNDSRVPGYVFLGSPWSGRTESVDDPITSIGPGLVYGLGKKVAVSVGSKMIGTPQTTGTLWHALSSRAIGLKYALNPNVEKVSFNLGYKKLWSSGDFKWGPRPDIGVLFRDGRTIAIEVMSKTDVKQVLINRNLNFGISVGRDIEVKTFRIPWVNYKK
jgi:hypothetical protein